MLAGRVTAQTVTPLHSFTGGSDGANPYGGLILSSNTLYGVAQSGGSSGGGTVFSVNTDGTGFTNLYSFTGGNDGSGPEGTLLLSANTLYGTTLNGGSNGNGAVFAVNTDGTGFTNLYIFSATNNNGQGAYTNSDGAHPAERLIISGNTLFGTTQHGGSSGNGVVFAVNADGSGFTNLHSFAGGTNGAIPEGVGLQGDMLFGATQSGGTAGAGIVFALSTNGSDFTNLFSTPAILSGVSSVSGNTLYLLTYNGGSAGKGTVISIQTDGTGYTNLYSFTATTGSNHTNSDGANPEGLMTLLGNTLYGTAKHGGSSGNGTLFSVNTNGTDFATLYAFTATDIFGDNSEGANPQSGLVLSGNTLYGTAPEGGASGYGTVFRLTPPGQPRLTITRSGRDVLTTWSTSATGFALESTTNFASPAVWTIVSSTPAIVNGRNTVTNPAFGRQQFFRLSQ